MSLQVKFLCSSTILFFSLGLQNLKLSLIRNFDKVLKTRRLVTHTHTQKIMNRYMCDLFNVVVNIGENIAPDAMLIGER
jgi:hypothetical protein